MASPESSPLLVSVFALLDFKPAGFCSAQSRAATLGAIAGRASAFASLVVYLGSGHGPEPRAQPRT
eukprot:10158917-Alexandrium_andersonii.AAC.1